MASVAQTVADNLQRIRERMIAATQAAGRDPASVRLVAVTKYVGADVARAVLEAGCRDLGESRPQELWTKAAASELAAARWHLIGRLQRNKVRRTLPLVDLIHSVDSVRLLAAIEEYAASLDLRPRVLLEVNCSGESAKQGFAAGEVEGLAESFSSASRVEIAGLMTMAPLDIGGDAARAAFAQLRSLRDRLVRQGAFPGGLRELSMGMSGDFEAAIAEGATIVRVGSALFEGLP